MKTPKRKLNRNVRRPNIWPGIEGEQFQNNGCGDFSLPRHRYTFSLFYMYNLHEVKISRE